MAVAAATGSTARTSAALPVDDEPATSRRTAKSRVIGKRDRTIADGKQVCDIDFAYADREPEDVFWEEPCAAVTATMVDRRALEALDRWNRLDTFQQKFVEQMAGGRVLQVEGMFSASIYPIDRTGTSIEISVAD